MNNLAPLVLIILFSLVLGTMIGLNLDFFNDTRESVSLSHFRDMCGLLKGQLRQASYPPFFKKEFCDVATTNGPTGHYVEFTFDYTFQEGGFNE